MSDEYIIVSVAVPKDAIDVALSEADFLTTPDNRDVIAKALVDKWETDLSDDLQELDFLVEAYEDDLEPDHDNVKAHRDWRMQQGEPDVR